MLQTQQNDASQTLITLQRVTASAAMMRFLFPKEARAKRHLQLEDGSRADAVELEIVLSLNCFGRGWWP
jgi:hypothetical protein